MNANINKINALTAEAVSIAAERKAGQAGNKATGDKLADKLRELAAATAAVDPVLADTVSLKFYAASLLQGVPKGTAGNYRQAIVGYVGMLADGKSIATGGGTDGTKPVAVPAAKDYAERRAMDERQRADADALAERLNEAGEYAKRLKYAARSAESWEAFQRKYSPESWEAEPDAVKVTKAEKLRQEAAAIAAAADTELSLAIGDDSTPEDGEDADADAAEDAAEAPALRAVNE